MAKRVTRRVVLGGAAAAAGAWSIPRGVFAQGKTRTVNLQLGWLAGNNQLGEVAAKNLGYFEEEHLELKIQPGGPNNDGIAVVASGRFEVGQVSSSPSLMLAASQQIPVTCFAVGAQQHPYAYFSLPKKPVRKPEDLIGKKVGIQATARILLTALLKEHNIPESKVEVVVIGSEMTPILTGQTDVVSGWVTNTTTLKVLGPERIDMRLWDAGVKLYALPYYATHDTIAKQPELLAAFTRAASRGWAWAKANTDKAVDFLKQDYPSLNREDEVAGSKALLQFVFDDKTKAKGWGTFEPAVWAAQIKLWNDLKQFSAGPPKLADVETLAILEATKDKRPKV
jgi:NitT/TauT family transport system substrate-binding protein